MSLFLHRPLTLRPPPSRAFSTTTHRPSSLQIDRNDPEAVADTVPAYPYGPARWYKQSNRGLYGGARLQFGNNVGPKSKTKSRRTWEPNIMRKRLHSRALDRFVQVRLSARVLRTIDKLGGLDEYLLGEKEARIKELGMSGWWLRWAIMQTPSVKLRFREERKALGLPEEGIEGLLAEMETTGEGEAQVDSKGEEVTLPVVPKDDAFQLEHQPLLPPIQFRVGKSQYIELSHYGWLKHIPGRRERFIARAVASPRLKAEAEEKARHEARILQKEQSLSPKETKEIARDVQKSLVEVEAETQWQKKLWRDSRQQMAEDRQRSRKKAKMERRDERMNVEGMGQIREVGNIDAR